MMGWSAGEVWKCAGLVKKKQRGGRKQREGLGHSYSSSSEGNGKEGGKDGWRSKIWTEEMYR
jgi:hypothetical protein